MSVQFRLVQTAHILGSLGPIDLLNMFRLLFSLHITGKHILKALYIIAIRPSNLMHYSQNAARTADGGLLVE